MSSLSDRLSALGSAIMGDGDGETMVLDDVGRTVIGALLLDMADDATLLEVRAARGKPERQPGDAVILDFDEGKRARRARRDIPNEPA